MLAHAIVVAELPGLRPEPKFVLVLPHGDVSKLPHNLLAFSFPDVDQLMKIPFQYEHSAEEYTFTLTRKDFPQMHGFCRRYRVGGPSLGTRVDLTPFSSSDIMEANNAPSYQCICILSEK